MRYVVVGPVYPYRGGIAHYTTFLHQALQARGHDVTVLSFRRQYPRFLFPGRSDRDPSLTAPIVPAEFLLDPIDPLTWWKAASFAAERAPEGLVIQWWVPFWAPAFGLLIRLVRRRTHARIVCICHNVEPHESVMLNRQAARFVLGQCDLLVVHSEEEAKKAQSLLPGIAIARCPMPTYGGLKPATELCKAGARASLGLKAEYVLLFFGLVRPYKGLALLLEALALARQQVPAHLLVVGEFWEPKYRYLRQIHKLELGEHVTIVDRYVPNEDLATYFAAADVLVLPYLSATQSAALQLGFSFGLPAIATAVGGFKEELQHGVNGLLVEPGSATALAAAIIDFWQCSLAQKLSAGVRKVANRFSWEAVVSLLEQAAQTSPS